MQGNGLLALPPLTHTYTVITTNACACLACAQQYLGNVAHCDDCSLPLIERCNLYLLWLFFIIWHYFSCFFYLKKFNISFLQFSVSVSAHPVNIMSFYSAMIFPTSVMQTAASYQWPLFTYGWPALKLITLVINLLFETISMWFLCVCVLVCVLVCIYIYTGKTLRFYKLSLTFYLKICHHKDQALFTNMDNRTFCVISTCSIGLTQAI